MVLETHMKLCVTEPDFPGNFFLPQKFGKWTQNGTKTGFFEFIGKFIDENSGNLKITLIIFALCWLEMGIAF